MPYKSKMNYTYKILNYSTSDNYTYSKTGLNSCSIITKMIQLAGRLCEHYASGIVYNANAFNNAIYNNKPYDKILFFREYGITTLDPDLLDYIAGTEYIQAWHLTYDPETHIQMFTRVYIKEEPNYND